MARDGFFTGLDIGSSTIKVLVAEHINGEMNVIGVSNALSILKQQQRLLSQQFLKQRKKRGFQLD